MAQSVGQLAFDQSQATDSPPKINIAAIASPELSLLFAIFYNPAISSRKHMAAAAIGAMVT